MVKYRKKLKISGQGMVEFALVIPVLLTIVVGIFEAGRAIYVYQAVATASREAARLGSSAGDNDDGDPYYLDCAAIRAAAVQFGNPGSVTTGDVTITYDHGPGTTSIGSCPVAESAIALGDRVIVTVDGFFQAAPAMPLFDFPDIPFTVTTRRTIIKEADLSDPDTTSTNTFTSTPTRTPTFTASMTYTPSLTLTASNTPTSTPTGPTATFTQTPTRTPTPSRTPTASKTSTASVTPSTTLTPSNTPTITLTFTNTATATETSTASNTPTPSLTPTPSQTPMPPAAPVWDGGTYSRSGDNCMNLVLRWGPSSSWTSNPGYGPSTYDRYINSNYYGAQTANYPNIVSWSSGFDVYDNQTVVIQWIAQFSGGISSQTLTKSWLCNNGDMIPQ